MFDEQFLMTPQENCRDTYTKEKLKNKTNNQNGSQY